MADFDIEETTLNFIAWFDGLSFTRSGDSTLVVDGQFHLLAPAIAHYDSICLFAYDQLLDLNLTIHNIRHRKGSETQYDFYVGGVIGIDDVFALQARNPILAAVSIIGKLEIVPVSLHKGEPTSRQCPKILDKSRNCVAYLHADSNGFASLVVNRPRPNTLDDSTPRNKVLVNTIGASISTDKTTSILDYSLEVDTDYLISISQLTFMLGNRIIHPRVILECDIDEQNTLHHFRIIIEVPTIQLCTYQANSLLKVRMPDSFGRTIQRPILWPKNGKHFVAIPASEIAARSACWRKNNSGGTTLSVLHECKPSLPEGEVPDRPNFHAEFRIPRFSNSPEKHTVSIFGQITIRTDFLLDPKTIEFHVGEREAQSNVRLISQRIKGFQEVTKLGVEITVPVDDIETMPIHNALKIRFEDLFGIERMRGIRWIGLLPKYLALHGPYYIDKEHELTAFYRQNVSKNTTLTVRHSNITDARSAHLKIGFAWALSKITFWINPILLFEKTAHHYEESGRVVFERLVDDGNDRAWFVINRETADLLNVEQKYRDRFLYQHTFKHYLYFFRCRHFLGTEAMAHCLELRCQSILVQRKLKSKKNNYVFMQHGVMYMVSLDSPERSSFRKKNMPGNVRIVASSELEAQHFIDYAGFKRSDIIVCGLPKFDRSYMNPGADKILVMPTWRPWEFAQMRTDPASTSYVKMINRIVEAIPDDLKDKVIIAPHPLFDPSLFTAGGANSNAISSYDEMLREVKLLITDYSSIAYDAFYRGANVIFYWEELEECLDNYGEPTHLMIDELTAFGPVCMNSRELNRATSRYHQIAQDAKYMFQFRRIVEFHDGNNTSRLIASLYL